ncbi:2Fe-2S iron-sulfur cluster-binding protein [Streptacidiphilus fuscans]|uniref:Sarcosine oxidase subunit alpha n=1 Tax=Streptacidiphilus fuscans TaxID=2789292 RepID=A0A931AWB4_9ACTN|nr:2Fe-2S iron-sulfur cluster-binding protein [Streptacidiphilus fuscans]MBF9066670.1 (2Fe-2S)-binding protein [Streptacidiphilus fuscans]
MTHRLPAGGRIDRSAPLRFTFDGVEYQGFRGDTLASALLANGVLTVGRSLYRDRPRGIVSAGVDEPHALVQVEGSCSEPMLLATTMELYDGLTARSLKGRGRLDEAPDEAADEPVHDKMYRHADVVVVGAGPAGLAAGLAAGRSGARVVLVDDQPELGGALLAGHAGFGREQIDGRPALEWVARVRAELAAQPETLVLTRSTAIGYHDHNYLLVAERRTDHLGPLPVPGVSRQRLWHVRAREVVLATGAHQRPMVFAGNDRPGVMSAAAVRTYVDRYAVLPGHRAVLFTTDDQAYATALDLVAAGAEVAALVDTRPEPPAALVDACRDAGIEVVPGSAVVATAAGDEDGTEGETKGEGRITGVRISALTDDDQLVGAVREVACDLLAVSGGWSPAVHLWSQSRGTVRYDDDLAAFVPDRAAQAVQAVGAGRGTYDLASCLREGFAAGAEAASRAGFGGEAPDEPEALDEPEVPSVVGDQPPTRPRPVWLVPAEQGSSAVSGDLGEWHDHFVDSQRDATVADVQRAVRAGMRSVEHIKRYTTIGTAHDQGKSCGVAAIGVIARLLGAGSPGEVGTTTFRGPYVPVSFALLAGRERGPLFDPVRTTPIHPWHVRHGAVFENVGQWKRPRYYPRVGESMDAAVLRECRAAREGVAVMDASTLGKIDVVGPDAGLLLDRLYTNGFAKLPVGSARYGVMCRPDGMVFDDGVTLRLAADHYYLTTTTGNAAPVLDWLEEWLQTEWPDLRVRCTSVTEQWATVAVVGPRSREVIAALAPELDVSNDAFPFMTVRHTSLANGVEARICRISFSGELAYEINVASWYGLAVWEAVLAYGAHLGITPYGTEAMHVLRAEKGYPIVGQDTDGTVTPKDLGMEWIVARHKHFVGKRSFRRGDTARGDRRQLVGLLPVDETELLPEGSQLVEIDADLTVTPVESLGHVTSSYRSAALGRTFALALVRGGRERIGETVLAPLSDGRTVPATITDPVLYDPKGARRDG